MFRKFTILAAVLLYSAAASAQSVKWYNPENAGFNVVQGQIMPSEEREGFYHRLPVKYKGVLRNKVWTLGKRSAGESLCFSTDSKEIVVRYKLCAGFSMPHMPSTGVSGLDLYTFDKDGNEIWLKGSYSFKDTTTYRYRPIDILNSDDDFHSYTLFLPLYNEVAWMEIGVEEGTEFRFDAPSQKKPIVAYGTSICQGACASRPAMAWTNILQRRLGRPVVNLGFSGNAMHEKEVIDMVSDVDAAVYIMDGLPNSCSIPAPALQDTLMKAVRQIRAKRPDTPILLTDHLGYPHGKVYESARDKEKHALESLEAAYRQLVKEGVKGLYRLRYEQIGMRAEMMVEGVHVSDYGMTAYADAYERVLRKILDEPVHKVNKSRNRK